MPRMLCYFQFYPNSAWKKKVPIAMHYISFMVFEWVTIHSLKYTGRSAALRFACPNVYSQLPFFVCASTTSSQAKATFLMNISPNLGRQPQETHS